MARFVSRIAKLSVGIRDEVSEHYATGQSKVLIPGLEAKFEPRGLTEYEYERGINDLNHRGLPEDRDTGREVSPRSRIGLFDSKRAQLDHGWSDEEHDLVVEGLRSSDLLGNEFIEVETPKRPAPWSGYDRLNAKQVLAAVEATGVDPREVLAYELENQARESVLKELELLLEDEVEQDVVIEA